MSRTGIRVGLGAGLYVYGIYISMCLLMKMRECLTPAFTHSGNMGTGWVSLAAILALVVVSVWFVALPVATERMAPVGNCIVALVSITGEQETQ